MAIAQNIGTMVTALLPALFAAVAPAGSARVPLTIGAITFAVTIVSSLAAWSARETSRIPLHDVGDPDAAPLDAREYARRRAEVTSLELARDISATGRA